jgi:hypothetical protein
MSDIVAALSSDAGGDGLTLRLLCPQWATGAVAVGPSWGGRMASRTAEPTA